MIMDKYQLQEEIYLMQQKLNYQINNDIELKDEVETHKEHFEFLKEKFPFLSFHKLLNYPHQLNINQSRARK